VILLRISVVFAAPQARPGDVRWTETARSAPNDTNPRTKEAAAGLLGNHEVSVLLGEELKDSPRVCRESAAAAHLPGQEGGPLRLRHGGVRQGGHQVAGEGVVRRELDGLGAADVLDLLEHPHLAIRFEVHVLYWMPGKGGGKRTRREGSGTDSTGGYTMYILVVLLALLQGWPAQPQHTHPGVH